MSDPVQAHVSLEQSLTVQQEIRDNADVYFATAGPALEAINEQTAPLNGTIEGIKGGDSITLTELNNLMGLILNSIDSLREAVDTLGGTVELLNNNASQNAQQQQAILLSQFNNCCVETAYGTGEVEDLCQKAQDAIAYVVARMLSISATYSGDRLPTVDELVRLFTYVGTDGRSYQLLAGAEAGQLLASLAALGVGNLSDLDTLLTDEGIKAAVLELLGTSNSAEQSTIRIKALSGSGFDTSGAAARAFFAAFSPTLINTLWKSTAIWDPAPYEDICTGPPPIEGTGWAERSTIVTETGVDNWSGTRNVWDLSSPTPGNISPLPYFSAGQTLYIQHCGNATNGEAERDETIWIGKSNSDPASIFMELPYRAERTWVCDGARYLYLWTKGQEDGAGNGVAYITASWIPADAATHCPE